MKKLTAAMLLASACTATAAQAEAGDVIVRLRAIVVAPNEKSDLTPDDVKLTNDVVPEIDFTYMLTNNIGAELIAATSKHKVSGGSAVAGASVPLASTYALPPTLTLQYHLAPQAAIRPYVGVGVNYTIFYSSKPSSVVETAFGQTKVHIKDSIGYALQAGVDIDLTKKFFLNFDVKYIDMTAKTSLRTTLAGTVKTKIEVRPFVFGVGFGTRF